MNECEKIRELISCMADGCISDSDMELVYRHTENCPECAELLDLYTAIASLREEDKEPPEELLSGVMDGVKKLNDKKIIQAGASRRKRNRAVCEMLAAAACAAIVLFTGIKVLPSVRSSDGLISVSDSVPDESTAAETQPMLSSAEPVTAEGAENVQYNISESQSLSDSVLFDPSNNPVADSSETYVAGTTASSPVSGADDERSSSYSSAYTSGDSEPESASGSLPAVEEDVQVSPVSESDEDNALMSEENYLPATISLMKSGLELEDISGDYDSIIYVDSFPDFLLDYEVLDLNGGLTAAEVPSEEVEEILPELNVIDETFPAEGEEPFSGMTLIVFAED